MIDQFSKRFQNRHEKPYNFPIYTTFISRILPAIFPIFSTTHIRGVPKKLSRNFPNDTSCQYESFAPNGNIQNHPQTNLHHKKQTRTLFFSVSIS